MYSSKKYGEVLATVENRFQFTVLLQKRVRELVKGAPPMVKVESRATNPMDTALQEYLEGKIRVESAEGEGKKKKK